MKLNTLCENGYECAHDKNTFFDRFNLTGHFQVHSVTGGPSVFTGGGGGGRSKQCWNSIYAGIDKKLDVVAYLKQIVIF